MRSAKKVDVCRVYKPPGPHYIIKGIETDTEIVHFHLPKNISLRTLWFGQIGCCGTTFVVTWSRRGLPRVGEFFIMRPTPWGMYSTVAGPCPLCGENRILVPTPRLVTGHRQVSEHLGSHMELLALRSSGHILF